MGTLFLSHSSKDNVQAIRMRAWLKGQGWNDIFLDLDPEKGITPGQLWQEELRKAGETCSAVILLLSPHWVDSIWCQTEFVLAEQLGKRIFPVLVAPTAQDIIRPDLKDKYQIGDISNPDIEAKGFDGLALGLKRAGLDPGSFSWPPLDQPDRPVYRGLQPLDVADAAIFFGRDAAITRGLDELRRMRAGTRQKMLVILAASGAGKSSFLRAGLISRLSRDELNFLVLPAVRPEQSALRGPQGLLAAVSSALSTPVEFKGEVAELTDLFAQLRRPIVDRLTRQAEATKEAWTGKPPTIVIPIDQAEELFNADNVDHREFCDLVADAATADGNVLIVLTIRTQSYESLQRTWMPESQLAFTLPPISFGAFKDVIEGPAKLAVPPVAIEPALTQALLADLESADALPLLAFTMARLQCSVAGDGRLTLQDYQEGLGGIEGAIRQAVSRATDDDPQTITLARRLFIPALVRVDDEGVKRRKARRAEIPSEAWALADRFIGERLLVSDRPVTGDDQVETLEVAHEVLLRQWPTLVDWIDDEQSSLRALEAVRAAATEWSGHLALVRAGWLAHHGTRLQEARAVIARSDFAPLITDEMRAYLDAAWRAEHTSRRVRRILQTVAVGLAATLLAGSLIYSFQFEIKRAWAQETMTHLKTASQIDQTGPSKPFNECGADLPCPDMLVLNGGDFVMGSPDDEPQRYPFNERAPVRADYMEGPQHSIHVKRFAIGQTDVTFDQWNACVAYTKQETLLKQLQAKQPLVGCNYVSDNGYGDKDRPAINVSWDDAQGYVRWLNLMLTGDADHGPYRLLSEAEWEYSARAGSSAPYFWGGNSDAICDYANFATQQTTTKYAALATAAKDTIPCTGKRDNFDETSPVKSFDPNPNGLYDMYGDVWQWVEDCSYPYNPAVDTADPVEQIAGSSPCQRELRGGSWRQPPATLRSARRGAYVPATRVNDAGFRIARTL